MKKLLLIAAIVLGIVVSTLGGSQLADPPGAGGFRLDPTAPITEPIEPTDGSL